MHSMISTAKKIFSWFSYSLVIAGVVLAAIIIFAPRPDGGFPPSHPLTVTTWAVMWTSCITVVFYVVCCVLSALVAYVIEIVRWIAGYALKASEAGA